MFARYIPIRLDSSGQSMSWFPIRLTIAVSQPVHFGNKAAKVDNELVERLRSKEPACPKKDPFQTWRLCSDR
jgi:hypothetical protein